jgi:hypothetical protein
LIALFLREEGEEKDKRKKKTKQAEIKETRQG